jgi:hypothetical protein
VQRSRRHTLSSAQVFREKLGSVFDLDQTMRSKM